MIRQTD